MEEMLRFVKADSLCRNCASLMGARFFGAIVLSLAIAVSGFSDPVLVVFIALFVLCDQCDGMLFRRSEHAADPGLRSLRRTLDSCIDRISVQAVNIGVLVACPDYLPLFLLVLFREALVSAPCVSAYARGYVLYPKGLSKLSTVTVAFLGSFYLLGLDSACIAMIFPTIALALLSFFNYRSMLRAIEDGKAEVGEDYEMRA